MPGLRACATCRRITHASVVLLVCATVLKAQGVPGKKYLPILPDRNVQVTISPLSLEIDERVGEIRIETTPVGFWRSKKTIGKDVYDLIEFDSVMASHTVNVGQAMVPIKVIEIEIPPKSRVKEVTLKPQVLTTIKDISLPPVQEALPVERIVVIREKETHAQSEDLSKSDQPYPGMYHEIIGIQHHGKRRLLLLKTFPAQYYPGARKLELCKLTGKITLELAEESKAKNKPDIPSRLKQHTSEYPPFLPAELLAYLLEVPGKNYVPILADSNVQVTASPIVLETDGRVGEIRIAVLPIGLWRSKETIGKDTYDLIEFDTTNPSHTVDVGRPRVPVKVIEIEIPPGAVVKDVILEPHVLATIEDVCLPLVQESLPDERSVISRGKETRAKSANLSKTDQAYPGKHHEIIGIQHHGKRRLLLLKMFLLQYYPGARKLELCKLTGKITLELTEEPTAKKK
ncbi:MAG: hypothetical protein GY845_35225 [Planctomycetes bacterium]|nr:hypothetical protein [Planctomycetota bacterium]